ncbi:MAG: LssY C-terminal domain-containing protein [Pseudolysinimonas sp.]
MTVTTRRAFTLWTVIDGLFFFLGAVAAGWVVWLTIDELVHHGIRYGWLLLVVWLVVAYLLLPRIHTMLALIYLPDYFIGRARLYDGLLGDPVNLVLRGTEAEVHTAMERAGWVLADQLGFRSGLRIVTSTLRRRSYAGAPVSPAFLFGRMQDFTYQQEVNASPARRHHVRFWRAPSGWRLPGGASVDWIGSASYDRSVGLSLFTLQITHKIASNTDVERDHIVRTLRAANPTAELEVISNFSTGYHSRTGGGDAIHTDGDLPIVGLWGLGAATDAAINMDDASAAVPAVPAAPATAHRGGTTLLAEARYAIENASNSAASNRVRRPQTLYIGYGLAVLRGLIALITALATFIGAPPLPNWGLLLAATIVGGVAYFVLVQLTFSGRLLARLAILTLSVVGALVALLGGPAVVDQVGTLWVANLMLDIGILVSLSAGDVRAFQLRASANRRANRRATRAASRGR